MELGARTFPRGIFQGDLAKMIGVDEITIVYWEKGRPKPTKEGSLD